MAYESSVMEGSGISVLRAGLRPGFPGAVPGVRGTNSVIVNYEDLNSKLGVVQSSGLHVAGFPIHVTGPAERLRSRRELRIQNMGPGLAYVGASDVTTTGGLCITSGTIITLDVLDLGDIYAISASTSDLRVLEIR